MKDCVSVMTYEEFIADAAKEIFEALKTANPWEKIPFYNFPLEIPKSFNDIHYAVENAEYWFGVKCIPNPFDTAAIMMVCDYYGGGCLCVAATDDMDGVEQIAFKLFEITRGAMQKKGYGKLYKDEKTIVEKNYEEV